MKFIIINKMNRKEFENTKKLLNTQEVELLIDFQIEELEEQFENGRRI